MLTAAAIGGVCILLWATALAPEIVTTFGFLAVATLTGVAKPMTSCALRRPERAARNRSKQSPMSTIIRSA